MFQLLTLRDGGPDKSQDVFQRYQIAVENCSALPVPVGGGSLALVFSNSPAEQDQSGLLEWAEMASGPRLDILYRGLRLIWKGDRILTNGPEHLFEPMTEAIRQFAVLQRAVNDLEVIAAGLTQAANAASLIIEARRSAVILRRDLAQASQAHSFALLLMLPVDLPQATGEAGPAMRVRMELTNQALLSERLGLVVDCLEMLEQQFDGLLERTLEARRGSGEAIVGFIIVVLLVAELLISLGVTRFR